LRHEAPELVAGVGLRQRHRSVGCLIARKDSSAFLSIESTGIQAQFFSQLAVKLKQPRLRHLRRLPSHVEALKFARIRILEAESRGGSVAGKVRHSVISSVRSIIETSDIILLDIDSNIYTCLVRRACSVQGE
jgi:hypothetical protein